MSHSTDLEETVIFKYFRVGPVLLFHRISGGPREYLYLSVRVPDICHLTFHA